MSDPNTSDPNKVNPETAQPAADSPAQATQPEPDKSASEGAEAAMPEPGPEQLKAIIASLQADLDQLRTDQKDAALRHLAEQDNLRKRFEREKEETKKFAIAKFATDLIGVADNFERALAAVPAGAADADQAFQSLVEGVGMIERELKTVLERHGVKRIWPEGEILNPHQHQAMAQLENPNVPANTILQVYQAGYMIDERVIRPAAVVVSKGGAKANKSDTGNGPAAEPAPPAPYSPEDPANSE